MNKKIIIILFILASILVGIWESQRFKTNKTTDQCYKSFYDFAYVIPPNNSPFQEKILPPAPWQIESQLPDDPNYKYHYSGMVEAIREINDHTEIWLDRINYPNSPSFGEFPSREFIVYRTDTKTWKTISAQVEGTNISIYDLFVTKDGSLYGQNGGRFAYDGSLDVTGYPILSKYNEESERFEFDADVKGIPSVWVETAPNTGSLGNWDKVLLDANNIFWIFAQHDSIYSYNPSSHEVVRFVDISDSVVDEITLSPDGNIYFRKDFRNMMDFRLEKDQLFQFFPKTSNVKPISIPYEPWPGFGNILVDHTGRLWLGAIGYRTPEGIWNMHYPRLSAYIWALGWGDWWNYEQTQPFISLESSDGRLWFVIPNSDGSGYKQGIAWLDPKTGTGCWFTSEGDNVVEDRQHNLWIVVDEKLYTYHIGP